MTEARFYEKKGGAVQCTLCPHECLIQEGNVGRCGVRRNTGGTLHAESYGRISGLALDPIEKKPLQRFYPGSYILSAGSYGCNMRCDFCQNSSISQEIPPTRYIAPTELVEIARSESDNIGIAFTYNEPFVGIEYILDTAPLAKTAGAKVVLVTNGLVCPEPLNALLPDVDAMNIDVKCFTHEFYRRLGGDLDTVKQTVSRCAGDCHVEVTTLIIPGKNDSTAEMAALSGWLASISPDIPLHITRFFPRFLMTGEIPTPVSKLYELSGVAKAALNYVYVGNV